MSSYQFLNCQIFQAEAFIQQGLYPYRLTTTTSPSLRLIIRVLVFGFYRLTYSSGSFAQYVIQTQAIRLGQFQDLLLGICFLSSLFLLDSCDDFSMQLLQFSGLTRLR